MSVLTGFQVINELGGIQAEGPEGFVYIEPGDLLHSVIMSGQLGEVAAYVPPPDPGEAPAFATVGAALGVISAALTAALAPLVADVPEIEQMSWGAKYAGALAYEAGTATPGQLAAIEAEAVETGEDPAALASAIRASGELFTYAAARAAGIRRRVRDALSAEADPYAFEPIVEAALPEIEALSAELAGAV